MQEVIMDKTAVYTNKHRENDGLIMWLCEYDNLPLLEQNHKDEA